MGELIDVRGTRLVGVNERGNRVGEDHQCAKLSDHEVELIRELAEPSDGAPRLTYRAIAEKFEISVSTCHYIVHFRRRATYPVGWRRIRCLINGRELVHANTIQGPVALSSAAQFTPRYDPEDNDR